MTEDCSGESANRHKRRTLSHRSMRNICFRRLLSPKAFTSFLQNEEQDMMRRIAVVGDKLETGGEVLPYSGQVFSIGNAGHRVALIGGTAWCEACKSTGVIAKAGGPRRIDFMGETAADRDVVLCKCPTPPRIVATLSGDSWCDDMAETIGVAIPNEKRKRLKPN